MKLRSLISVAPSSVLRFFRPLPSVLRRLSFYPSSVVCLFIHQLPSTLRASLDLEPPADSRSQEIDCPMLHALCQETVSIREIRAKKVFPPDVPSSPTYSLDTLPHLI